MQGLSRCQIMNLPKIEDRRGNLSFVQSFDQIPFGIERVYFVYDVPGGSERGGHAHKELHQFIIPVSGSFDVALQDGTGKEVFRLNAPFKGLYVAPMVWRDLVNFSSGAVCLVLASEKYDESDYIRDFSQFLLEANV